MPFYSLYAQKCLTVSDKHSRTLQYLMYLFILLVYRSAHGADNEETEPLWTIKIQPKNQ